MVLRRSFSPAAAPTTLTADITNGAVALSVADGSTFVDGTVGPSVLTIDRGKSNEERILYTSRVGNAFSGLTRGYNGTAAQGHTAGAIVEHTSTQQDFDEANAHLSDPTRNDHTQYALLAAANAFTDDDNYFGANAAGDPGTRIHLGSLGDANNAYVTAEGSGADVGLIFRSKGAGGVSMQTGAGAPFFAITPGGQLQLIGGANVASSATAGAASALPGLPAGYLIAQIAGANYKLPYFAN